MKWLVGVALAGCMSPVMHFGSGKSAEESQHDYLSELLPAQLSLDREYQGPVKDAKIRVYADDEYRAQNIRWRETFGEQLEYANAVLGPKFGVHLVAEYRDWDHHAPGNSLPDDLKELSRLDAGDDVLSVVGLTSSLSLVSATFDLLGYASEPGRHIMLRGFANLEERAAFARAFPSLPADERDNALEARRRHKTAAVFLHELAHNLGAPHQDGDTLMNPTYSEHAAAFSAAAHATIQRTLDQRLGRASEALPQTAAAPAQPRPHRIMYVVLAADGASIDGRPTDDGTINMAFSTAAALDDQTEVVISKDKTVPSARLIEVMDRAKKMGLSKFTFK